jgi:hypothetical protein
MPGRDDLFLVMPANAGIHVFLAAIQKSKTWMAGTRLRLLRKLRRAGRPGHDDLLLRHAREGGHPRLPFSDSESKTWMAGS